MPKRYLIAIVAVAAVFLAVVTVRAYINTSDRSDIIKQRFYSASLHKEMNVDVFLPPDYNPKTRYPVLYLLHGKDANQNSWMTSFWGGDSIHIDEDATQLIREREMRPLIIVSPEIDNGYGINTSKTTVSVGDYSRGQYADFITKDLVRYINTHYNVIQSRNGRFIGGYSMGGFAALHAAFTRQDLYSKVGVMSAALWNGALPSSLSWIYPTSTDQTARDPITIARHTKIKIPVYIIEGQSDPFYSSDITLARVLRAQSAEATLKIYPGGHDYAFWKSHATELLLFFAQ